MAVPTIRATGSVTVGTSSSITATLPTHASGDLLICFGGGTNSNSATPTMSTPSGWTQVGTVVNSSGTRRALAVVWAKKAASSSETNPASTCSPTGTTYTHYAIAAISITTGTWYDTGTLANAWEDVTTNTGTTSSVDLTGLVTTGPDRLCLAGLHNADDTATGLTNTASYSTVGTDSDSSTGADGYFGRRSLTPATSGGGATFTFTSGGTVGAAGVSFAVIPAPRTYDDSLTETPTAADSLTTTATWPNSFTETPTATDGLTAGLAFDDSFTETASSSDTISPAWTARNSLTETPTAEEEVETEDSVYVSAFTETPTAGDTVTPAWTARDSLTETPTAGDSLSDSATWPNALTETAASTDGLVDELVGAPTVYDDSITEAATADDAVSYTMGAVEEGAAGPFPWWWPDGYRLRKKAPQKIIPWREPEPPPKRQPQVYAVEVYALAYATDSVGARAGWGVSIEEPCLAGDAIGEIHTPRRQTERFLRDERDMAELIALWARHSPLVHRLGETRGK